MQIELVQLKNPISFRNGVIKVLTEACGEPLRTQEIWRRMKEMGIMSNSSNPSAWVDRVAKQVGATKVGPRTWMVENCNKNYGWDKLE